MHRTRMVQEMAKGRRSLERVMIVGAPGSGKSTLARQMGGRLGLPVVHMDHIHWRAGWVERAQSEKTEMLEAVYSTPQWIVEGGHSRSFAQRVARAQMMVWLDVPVGLRLWRVLRRSWRFRGQVRPDLPEGCPEEIGWRTVEFVSFILRTRRQSRARIAAIAAAPPAHLQVVRLGSLPQVRDFLERLEGERSQ
ncbi:MAG: DNA topology modulation protein FlaR [Pseudomonadota bacterium]